MRGGKKIEERMVKMDIIPKMKMWEGYFDACKKCQY